MEIIEAERPEKALVDLNLDDKPIGRLVVNHDKAYGFNLKTEKPEKKKGELLVDLKIDGKRGPIPKVVFNKPKMGKVFVDKKDEIDTFKVPYDQM